jgi:hypothetical protein
VHVVITDVYTCKILESNITIFPLPRILRHEMLRVDLYIFLLSLASLCTALLLLLGLLKKAGRMNMFLFRGSPKKHFHYV